MRALHLLTQAPALSAPIPGSTRCENCGRTLLFGTDKETNPLFTTSSEDFYRAPMDIRCAPLSVTDKPIGVDHAEGKSKFVRTSIK